jgi:DNA polymerase-3 subunit gamma/tau
MQDVLLKENIDWDIQALVHIAKMAKGGMRDALSLLDQCTTYGNKITIENVREAFGEIDEDNIADIAKYIAENNVQALLEVAHNLYMQGKQLSKICSEMYEYYKEEYLHGTIDNILGQRYMRIFCELQEKLKYSSNAYTIFEIELIKICKPQMEQDYGSLYERIHQLEVIVEKLSSGTMVHIDSSTKINPEEFVKHVVTSCRRPKTCVYYI